MASINIVALKNNKDEVATFNESKLTQGLKAFQECRWNDAATCFREILAENGFSVDVAEKLGFSLSQARQHDEAASVFERIFAQQPYKAKWPYMVGYRFYARSQWQKAIQWFDKALSLDANYVKALYRKAYAHVALGQQEQAVTALNACIDGWQRLPPEFQQTERKYFGKANYQLGKLLLAKGFSLKARRLLEIAVRFEADDPDVRYQFGKCLLAIGKVEEATAQLREAEKLRPGKDYVTDRLAQALMKIGNLKEAEDLYARIPDRWRREYIWRNIGILHHKQGNYAKAAECLRLAIRKEHNNHHSHFHLGLTLEALGDLAQAQRAFQEAVKIRRERYKLDYPEAETRLQQLEQQMLCQGISLNEAISTETEGGWTMGRIDGYIRHRGFGFIRTQADERVFFHISELPSGYEPKKGDNVAFEIAPSAKGLNAVKVRPVSA